MPKIDVKVPFMKPANQLSSSQNGIIIYLYSDIDSEEHEQYIHIEEFDKIFSVEELCLKAAEHLEIGSIAFPIFALAKQNLVRWYPPKKTFVCRSDKLRAFVYRIRFIPSESRISQIASQDKSAFNYLFHQVRDDFLNDRIQYKSKSFGQERVLGLGVIDMLRYAKERQIDLEKLLRLEPQNFIPKTAKSGFKFFWDKKRLQLNFKPHLEKEYKKYNGDNDINIKVTYISAIFGYAEHYGMETFNVKLGTDEATVVVKPYDEKFPGFQIFVGNNLKKDQEPDFHSLIEDLMDISVAENPPGMIHINRKTGTPKVIIFDDQKQALSFILLLDGYYRLQEDYHHHLCRDVESKLMMQLHYLRSHGPVGKDWAADQLTQRHSVNPEFNFMLKQKEKGLGHFVLIFLSPAHHAQPFFFPVAKLPDGRGYQLTRGSDSEPIMSDMLKLVEYYRNDENSFLKLKKCVLPSNPLDSKIYLCREYSSHGSDTDNKKQQKAPVCLVSMVQCHELIGEGAFTRVFKSSGEKEPDDTRPQEIVVKQLRNKEFFKFQSYFTAGIHHTVFWGSCPTIVSIHAVCFAPPLSLIMEGAACGNLQSYMRVPKFELKIYHLVVAAEQIAQALCFLEEHNETHGNIRCRNVLVFKHEPRGSFVVKLSDPGMVYLYNDIPLEHPINIERLPWIAPECYTNLKDIAPETDRFSYGMMLWEVFSSGDIPFQGRGLDEVTRFVLAGQTLEQPEYCPDEMFLIMKSCWNKTPDFRMKPKEIVRNIRHLLTKEGDVYTDYSDPDWLDKKDGMQSKGPTRVSSVDGSVDGSAAFSLSSQVAAIDNDINMKRLKQTLLQSNRRSSIECRPSEDLANSSLSPSGDSLIQWDSRTPLIRKQLFEINSVSSNGLFSPTSPTFSGESNWSQTTQRTELESLSDIATGGETGAIKLPPKFSQSRPLPQLPLDSHDPHEILPFRLKWNANNSSDRLGQGHYGEVFKGSYCDEHGNVSPVAIKCLKSKMYHKFAKEFEDEFRIMVALDQPNIVKIIGQCPQRDSDRPMLLVMEFVEKGCLRDFLQHRKGHIPLSQLLRYGCEIAEGMTYLAHKKIVHRDLAARNVLVTSDDHMKISDFGLSRALSTGRDYYKCDTNKELPAPWCAPEALLERKFTEKTDIWSYGVTLWEIYSFGSMPQLCDIECLVVNLHDGKRLSIPQDCPQEVYRIMLYGCWQYYPNKRDNFQTILEQMKRLALMASTT